MGPVQTASGVEYQAPAPPSAAPDDCQRLEIEPTPGGFTATCFYRPSPNKRGSPSDGRDPVTQALSSIEDLIAFVGQTFGAPAGAAAPPPAAMPMAADDHDDY